LSQQITLNGQIVDEQSGATLGGANVVLMSDDSTFVKGVTADATGHFTLDATVAGDYLLSATFNGYERSVTKLANLSVAVDLGEIYLSPVSQTLDEVVVRASNRIVKVDRQIVLPSAAQLKSSNSGYELLNSLMLPGLRVDPIQNTVAVAGNGTVQLRINGVQVSETQLKSLRPANVLRVEYIDNPGVRYGDDVSVVINFVVKQMESGVSLKTDLSQSPFVGFGNHLLSVHANRRKSEFGVDYFVSYRDYNKRFANIEERYALPDGVEMQREQKGIEQPFGYVWTTVETSYNLTHPDKYVFYAVFKNNIMDVPNNDYACQINYIRPALPSATASQHAVEKNSSPALDLYYQHQIAEKQNITLNTVGSIINSDYERRYTEQSDGAPVSEYAYSTDGKKHSFIGEGIYENELKPFTLTSGLKYTQGYTKNIYTGSTDAVTQMRNASLYVFAQLQGNLKRLNYQVGLGFSRSSFVEAATEYSFVTLQPNVSLSYSFTDASTLRYRFSVVPVLPSLSALSDIEQDLDDFRINRGNPNLKPYRKYQNSLVYQYKKNLFSGTLNGGYNRYQNPIMEDIFREDADDGSSTFVYTQNNQKTFQTLSARLSLVAGPVKDIVTFTLGGGVNRFFSEGHSYYHQYTNWYINAGVNVQYKQLSFYFNAYTRENRFYGESMSEGEAINIAGLQYRIKNCRAGLSMFYPFSDAWRSGGECFSDIAYSRSQTTIKENGHMLVLHFAWNVNYGKKHQSGRKTLNNADNDSGIVK
jgi:hypothetical protein